MARRLAGESSPYLRQHADNPVDWYPWGDEAFAAARELQKPVLLSVGYSACHWCHVMAHESFENPEIAALMNDLFINIKVDREERPDIDAIYMQAVQALTGHGGWPMTVFLMPDGRPYFGGTYFPPEPRHGVRDFPTVLRAAAEAYQERRESVEAAGEQLREFLQPPTLPVGAEIDDAQLHTAAHRLLDDVDWEDGGFRGAPKFPHANAVDFLLQRFAINGDPRLWDAASVCLDRMERGGIHDQVGGGFHRYSVDATWSVPHFEKMLYDNAQLVPAYLHAYQLSRKQRWRDVVTRTCDYLIREMTVSGGAFAASQDADSEGGEGSFFVWDRAGLEGVLGADDAAFASDVFGITDAGNFEHGTTVLHIVDEPDELAARLGMTRDAFIARLDDIRARLLAARQSRPHPARDDKVITAWNALAISALAEAGAVLARDDYVSAARTAADHIIDALYDGVRLRRTWLDGRSGTQGFLDDTAGFANALLTLFEASGEARYYRTAHELAESIPRLFEDDGRLHDTWGDGEALLIRPRTLDDTPVPAGQSLAALLYIRFAAMTGADLWTRRALAIIRPLSTAIARTPLALATLASAQQNVLLAPREVAIVGDPADAATRALVATVWERYEPGRVIAWGDDGTLPLLEGRSQIGGVATAYVCENFTCELPATDPAALRERLAAHRVVGAITG